MATRSHQFTVEMSRCNHKFYVNSFFYCTFRLWNSVLIIVLLLFYLLNTSSSLTLGNFLCCSDFIALLVVNWLKKKRSKDGIKMRMTDDDDKDNNVDSLRLMIMTFLMRRTTFCQWWWYSIWVRQWHDKWVWESWQWWHIKWGWQFSDKDGDMANEDGSFVLVMAMRISFLSNADDSLLWMMMLW